jgi:hypothetical protein
MTTFTDATPMVTVHADHHNELAAAVDNLQGLVGNSVLSGTWRWTTSTTDASASGRVGINAVTWATATQLNLNETTLAGGDATNVLAKLKVGDGFYLQDHTDASRWARYTISGTQLDQGTWRAFPVTFVDASEPPPQNNADTIVTLTVQGGTSAALDLKVDEDSVTAAATRVVANMLAAGDTQPAWQVLGSGQMQWGVGGTSAPDVTLGRTGVSRLSFGTTSQKARIDLYESAGTDVALVMLIGSEANARWVLRGDGSMVWGPGGGNTQDITLARGGAGILNVGTTSQKGALRQFGAAAADILSDFRVTTDANARFSIRADGYQAWGPGSATQDTTLYRSAADRLMTDDLFDATTLAVATKVKAGTPVDADWAVAPPNGTIVADSTGNKLWVRVGGVWKGATIA